MMSYSTYKGYSLVTAILPRQNAGLVIDELLDCGAAHAMTTNARGTVVQEHWYQSFLPAISPEQDILRLLVPDQDVDRLMEQIVMVGKLQLYGAGSIFATPCEDLVCSSEYPIWTAGQYQYESVSFDIQFKPSLRALVHITDRGAAESIAQAAMKAGAQGATITYIRGYGLRDRLGLLRVTKKHDKELVTVVVDEFEVDAVFQAMAQAGRVIQPGRGLIYEIPISKGLTNLAAVFRPKKHSVSIQQMIRAIDTLHGGTQWRANRLHVHDEKAKEFIESSRGISKNVRSLNILSHRKDTDTLLSFLLDQGVTGASVSNWRYAEPHSEQTQGGLRVNREFSCISLVLNPLILPDIRELLQELITENEMIETCFFTHAVPLVKSFVLIG